MFIIYNIRFFLFVKCFRKTNQREHFFSVTIRIHTTGDFIFLRRLQNKTCHLKIFIIKCIGIRGRGFEMENCALLKSNIIL